MTPKQPSYCLHRGTGLAYVTVRENGKRRVYYLGRHGTPESYFRFAEIVREHSKTKTPTVTETENGTVPCGGSPLRVKVPTPPSPSGPTVSSVARSWLAHCETYYVLPSGLPSREVEDHRRSWEPLLTLFADAVLETLTRRDWVAVREEMIVRGWSRGLVTQRWGRIRRGLLWAVDQGLLSVGVESASRLSPLPVARSAAPERDPIRPVALEVVRATQRELSTPVREMVELQLLLGLRPGEVRELRKRHVLGLDKSPYLDFGRDHKMSYRGRTRRVPLPPVAVELLSPFFERAEDADSFLFSPQTAPKGANRKRRGYYTRHAYDTSIKRAAKRAGVLHWHPNQIRHLVATEVRRLRGLEAAQVLLDHEDGKTTEIYAEKDKELAADAVAVWVEFVKRAGRP
jgi:integrase